MKQLLAMFWKACKDVAAGLMVSATVLIFGGVVVIALAAIATIAPLVALGISITSEASFIDTFTDVAEDFFEAFTSGFEEALKKES